MGSLGHVVVMGGAGYLGGHAVVALRQRGYLVTAVDDLSTGVRQHADLAQHFLRLDVRDRSALHALLTNRPTDAVVQLAGLWGVARGQREPEVAVEVNVGGTSSLLGAMRTSRLKRLVMGSDLAVHAEPGASLAGQIHPVREDLVARCREAWGLQPAILRFGQLEGVESEWGACDPRHPARCLIRRAPAEKPGSSDGLGPVDLLHVSDAATAIVVAVDRLMDGALPVAPMEVGLGHLVPPGEIDSALKAVSGERGHRAAAPPSGYNPPQPADPTPFRTWAPDWSPRYIDALDLIRSAWEAR